MWIWICVNVLFKCIFFNSFCPAFIRYGPTDKTSALGRVTAAHKPVKLFPDPKLKIVLPHIYVARPQSVNVFVTVVMYGILKSGLKWLPL